MKSDRLFPRLALVAVLGLFLPVLHAQEAMSAMSAEDASESADAEVPPSVLARYDRNRDGKLDEAERARWQADLAARRERYRAEREAMLERFDTNRDGRLSAEEHAAAKLEMQRERLDRDGQRMRERAERQRAEREKAEREAAAKVAAAKAGTTQPAETAASEESDGEDMMMR